MWTANDFIDAMNFALNECAPLKKANKYKLMFKAKPWITSGIKQSIYV